MTGGSQPSLGATTAAFLAANVNLRTSVASNAMLTPSGALRLFCVGNVMMVRLMRESGFAVAVSIAAIVQSVLLAKVAVLWFRRWQPSLQLAAMGLGADAVALIASPRGGRG